MGTVSRRRSTVLTPGTPGQRASRRIREWPDGVSKRKATASRHARLVWDTARGGMVSRSRGLWAEVDGDAVAFAGQIDLAFLATVAGHLRRCGECWREWSDGEVPADLLTAAVARTPAGQVFRAVLTDIRAQRRPARR